MAKIGQKSQKFQSASRNKQLNVETSKKLSRNLETNLKVNEYHRTSPSPPHLASDLAQILAVVSVDDFFVSESDEINESETGRSVTNGSTFGRNRTPNPVSSICQCL